MKYKNFFLLAMLLISTASWSAVTKKDLVLENSLYLRNFSKFTCNTYTDESIGDPSYDLKALQTKMGDLTIDRQIQNTLLKISFQANGVTCRYSILSKRIKETKSLKLAKSKVFAEKEKDSACEAGKIVLDNVFQNINYDANGPREEFITLILKNAETEKACPAAGSMKIIFDKNRNRVN